MKIQRAQHAGFCYGVSRATRMAQELLSRFGPPIFTLGPLMHNPQEVQRLAVLGIVPRERIDDCIGAKTLIRTHGISRDDVARARVLGVDLVDTTCPRVKASRRHVRAMGRQDRTVFLLGDRGHPEVQALLSYAAGPVLVVSGKEELPDLPRDRRVGVVAQTTQSKDAFARLAAACRARFQDTTEVCTICTDTETRQQQGLLLAREVDLMVVIGGLNSANTCRLYELCRSVQPRTILVESAAELRRVCFEKVEKTGIISGASTPDWIVDEVEEWLLGTRREETGMKLKSK